MLKLFDRISTLLPPVSLVSSEFSSFDIKIICILLSGHDHQNNHKAVLF